MNMGGSSFVSAGQSAFVNTLTKQVRSTLPALDPNMVITTGATEIRNVFSSIEIPRIIAAYMAGINTALIIPIAATGLAFVFSLFARWERLNSKATKEAVAAA